MLSYRGTGTWTKCGPGTRSALNENVPTKVGLINDVPVLGQLISMNVGLVPNPGICPSVGVADRPHEILHLNSVKIILIQINKLI